jgi:methyl-accepting chemotaxis protein
MLRNMSIAVRATMGFALVALLVFVLGLFSLYEIRQMRDAGEKIELRLLPSIVTAADLNQHFLLLRIATLRLTLADDPAAIDQGVAELDLQRAKLADDLAGYQRLVDSPEEQVIYERLRDTLAGYFEQQQGFLASLRGADVATASRIANGKMREHAEDTAQAMRDLVALNQANASQAAATSLGAFDEALFGVIAVLALAAALTIVLATVLTRSIVLPLKRAVEVAESIAGGDLTAVIQVHGRDEAARLLGALHGMQQSLRETLRQISDSSDQLASASEELHAVTEDATRGLHQQSREIEQAATAVNEMTAAVEEVARNAVSTSEASQQTDGNARHGREQVLRTVQSINALAGDVTGTAQQVEQLAGSVRDISKVLDVIRAIAEQTNLLALNAAIEAARAGDAGRGFAVVADEVRALAHRTQQSTQEIEQMIGSIQNGTESAVGAMQNSNTRARATLEIAQAAGEALEQITLAITEINERNLLIASASEQQAQVAREVDRNLVNIRDLSVQTSAGANQTSAASQELSRLAVNLNGVVARFRL